MLEKNSEKKFMENKIPKKVIIPKENQKNDAWKNSRKKIRLEKIPEK